MSLRANVTQPDSLTVSLWFTNSTFGVMAFFVWGIHPIYMVDSSAKNTSTSIQKLVKLELCSDHFFSCSASQGLLNNDPTIWLDGARSPPPSMLLPYPTTPGCFFVRECTRIHGRIINTLCWWIYCQENRTPANFFFNFLEPLSLSLSLILSPFSSAFLLTICWKSF